jgi:hypothetical protein
LKGADLSSNQLKSEIRSTKSETISNDKNSNDINLNSKSDAAV